MLQGLRERVGRELDALISVEDLGAALGQSRVERFQAEPPVERVRQLPSDHIATEPVQNGDQIHKPVLHRQIGNVSTPDLPRMGDRYPAQQIRIDPVLRACHRGTRLGINRLQSHHLHEPLDPLVIDEMALLAQDRRHFRPAIKGRPGILLIDQPHEPQILGRFTRRGVIPGRAIQAKELALTAQTEQRMLRFHQGAQGARVTRQLFF